MRVPPPGMCFYHPSLPAVYICNRCGRAICRDDSKAYMDLVLCPQCYAGIVPPMAMAPPPVAPQYAPQYAPAPAPPPAFAPMPGPMIGPVGAPLMPGAPARSLWGFIISMVAGLLVLLNAGLLLAPQFYDGSFQWANIFFWIAKIDGFTIPVPAGSIGSISFVLGAIIGLVIIVGSILMILGYGTIGSIVVFPMAVFSLVIGGGFIAGFVLGIIGGIMGMIGR